MKLKQPSSVDLLVHILHEGDVELEDQGFDDDDDQWKVDLDDIDLEDVG